MVSSDTPVADRFRSARLAELHGTPPTYTAKHLQALSRAMAAAQDAWSRALAQVSIADLAADIDADSDGTAMTAVRRWLTT